LRRGHEYEVQSGYRDQDQRLFKPDLVLHIPGGKALVVDSKMTLTAWQKVVNSDSDQKREEHLRNHCRAIDEHLKDLSGKNYQDLVGLNSLDFVLMFIPVEAAFAAAVEHDPALFKRALDKNISIVTPTTLLATLRTVENVWKYERQNKNAAEIARRAGSLYDKFRGFVEELEKIGKQLALLNNAYEASLTRLCRGKGNLVSQAEQLKDLGVRVKKELPKSITDVSELDF
jgi:DNA recombination protein RmuC